LNSALFGRLAAGLTVALLTILIAGSVAAQEPKPAKPAKAAKPAAAKPARPAGTPAASKPKPAAKPAAAVPEPSEVTEMPAAVDPAVEAILDTKPSTPSELVRAAKILAQLNRPTWPRICCRSSWPQSPTERNWAPWCSNSAPRFSRAWPRGRS